MNSAVGGRRAWGATAGAVLTGVLVLSGCSSGVGSVGSQGSNPGGSPGASGSGDPAGPPIVIGTVCDCTGAAASDQAGIPTLVTAWADMINASGGINGHPVKVIEKDTASSATTAVQVVRELVEQDHVMAIVGETSSFDGEFQGYVEQKGVPVVGGEAFGTSMITSTDFFPSGGDLPAVFYGLGSQAKQEGTRKLALVVCAELPTCGKSEAPFAKLLHNAVGGLSLAYSAKVLANAPDYTAPCLAAQQAKADGMFVEEESGVTTRVVDSCAQQGYKPKQFGIASTAAAVSVLNDPNMNGTTVIEYNLSTANTSTPGGRQFQDALQKYGDGVMRSQTFGSVYMEAWAGFQLFAAAGKPAKLTPSSTPQDVKNGLYSLKNETLGGLAPPLNYVKGQPTHINCWFTDSIENGNLVDTSGGRYGCVPASAVPGIFELYG